MNSTAKLMWDLNQASLILANKRAALGNKWAVSGSILDRGREILQHAQDYLSSQAEELGNQLS